MKMQIGVGLILAATVVTAQTAQNAADTPEAHVAIAQTAAGEDYQNLFNFMCAMHQPAMNGQILVVPPVPGISPQVR